MASYSFEKNLMNWVVLFHNSVSELLPVLLPDSELNLQEVVRSPSAALVSGIMVQFIISPETYLLCLIVVSL